MKLIKYLIVLVSLLILGVVGVIVAVPRLAAMTFEVSAPANTPAEDIVFIKFESLQSFPLKKVGTTQAGKQLWRGRVSLRQLGSPGGKLSYSYVRNNYHSYGTEYLPPERDNPEFPKHLPVELRTVELKFGGKVNDAIERWRWFPADGEPAPAIPSTEATSARVADRVKNEPFQAGVVLSDLWTDEYEIMLEPTLKHLKAIGVNWLGIKPPWDFTEVDPLPKLENTRETVPGYPEDKLRLVIRQAKKFGFQVYLEPQICCTEVQFENQSEQWWGEFERQLHNWLDFHIKVATSTGVDLMILGPQRDIAAPVSVEMIWQKLFERMRNEFPGKTALAGGLPELGGEVLPTPSEAAPYLGLVDAIALEEWSELVPRINPTRDEVIGAVKQVFDQQIEPFYQAVNLPIIMIAAYHAMSGAAMGTNAPGTDELELGLVGPEKNLLSVVPLDLDTQAWIYDALLAEIAQRPYLIGFYPFGYAFIETRKDPGGIRGKPAEVLVSNWYQAFGQ